MDLMAFSFSGRISVVKFDVTVRGIEWSGCWISVNTSNVLARGDWKKEWRGNL